MKQVSRGVELRASTRLRTETCAISDFLGTLPAGRRRTQSGATSSSSSAEGGAGVHMELTDQTRVATCWEDG